jgi:hypothetical protein
MHTEWTVLFRLEDAGHDLEPPEILNIATSVKTIGSEYFKKGDYASAAGKYNKVSFHSQVFGFYS